jgi:hypothetical protein
VLRRWRRLRTDLREIFDVVPFRLVSKPIDDINGGGLLISNIVSPQQPKQGSSEVTRLERRMSPEPIPANGKLEPVPYLAASQISAAIAETPAPQPQPQAIAAASRACANSGASS